MQRYSVTSLETARSLANGPSWGGGGLRDKYVFCVPLELQRLLSLFYLWEESVGGAQRRGKFSSLEGKHMLPLLSIMILWFCTFQIHDIFQHLSKRQSILHLSKPWSIITPFKAMIYSTPLKPWSIPAPPESNIRDMAFDN